MRTKKKKYGSCEERKMNIGKSPNENLQKKNKIKLFSKEVQYINAEK